MDITYIGESLWQGRLGHLLLILSFVSSFISLLSFGLEQTVKDLGEKVRWHRLGKQAFLVHAVAIVGVIALLYTLIFGHHYEYDYVRRHSNETMSVHYLISCFWAGQQGSFLVWVFWHAVVGTVLLFTTKRLWVGPVLGTFALIQLILSSMVLGIYVPRAVAVVVLVAALHVPLWLMLQRQGVPGWRSLIPGWGFLSVMRLPKGTPMQWLMIVLAIPLNVLLIIALLKAGTTIDYLAETVKLGVSPFALAREEFSNNAIFLFSDYMQRINGMGLNPLLENYWMVIHPPTLFLGFALTLVPFAFGMAGLVTRRYSDWIKPALSWTVLATMILGIGILMGGMWAYESLSFGGFWAWDPVENASLVPWLTLIAGLHTMLIFRSSGHALKATLLFFTASVFLVLYSTFLTRSGILGDSSVHSFTDLGMMGQLIILIVAIMLPALIMMAVHWKHLPSPKKEESAYSREFWMFIGTLVLMLSTVHIIFTTSLPVFNSIAAWLNSVFPFLNIRDNAALPKDVVSFYNSVQVWIAVLIALLTAMVQWLKFKTTNLRVFLRSITPALLISLVLTAVLEYIYRFDSIGYMLLLFAGLFAIIANGHYIIQVLKGRIKVSGSALAHIGFGLMMVGIIISLSKSEAISKNYLSIDYGEGFDQDFKANNLYLLKDRTYFMGEYMVTFSGKEVRGGMHPHYYYQMDYKRIDPETGKLQEEFSLTPNILMHPDMGAVAHPSTKRYLHRDIFTHITSIPMGPDKKPLEVPHVSIERVGVKDSFFTSRGMVVLEGINRIDDEEADMAAVARLKIDNLGGTPVYAEPVFMIKGNEFMTLPAIVEGYGLEFEIQHIDPDAGRFSIKVTDHNDWLIMKAIVFPWINLLWLGIAITMLGMIIAMMQRIREYNRTRKREEA